MDRRFLAILAGLVIIFGGIFAVSQHKTGSSDGTSSGGQPTKHIEGQGKAGVTLVEYGDYECPVCSEYYLPLKQAESQLSSQIYFQFSNLPLTSIHPNAYGAARAAEAAGLQNQYWQMHDLLYANQSAWASSSKAQTIFDGYARQLGLNVTKFDQDYASSQVNDSISADMTAFGKTGQAQATPTFFLDGKFIDNSQFIDPATGPSATKIVQVLQAEITAKIH